jgi:hypothetical protein
MKLLSSLFTFVIIFSVFALQAQKSKQGRKGKAVEDTIIIADTTPPKVEEGKSKKNKITDQMFMDRLDKLEGQLVALQGILVNADSIPNMSPYMLRSEHEKTEYSLEEMRTTLKVKEIELNNMKTALNAKLSLKQNEISKLTREKNILSAEYSRKQEEYAKLKNQIDKSKKILEDERKANQKITNDLVVAFLKQETADLAMVQKMITLDKKLNSGKHDNDLNNFNDIQKLIVQGRAILNKALNTAEINKYKSDIQTASVLKTKYAKSFVVISKIENQIEDYIKTTCSIQRKVNVILGSKLNAEQKKDRLATRVIDEDDLEYVKSNFPYLYKEMEHTKKSLQWRIRFECD